jgi:hypothetical protein
MKKEFKNFEIEYNKCDLEYIDEVIFSMIKRGEEVMDFFKLDSLDNKVKIKFFDDILEYREYVYKKILKENGVVKDWEIGRAGNTKEESYIIMLSYGERLKAKGHENDKIQDMEDLIIHEFVHTCHIQFKNYQNSLNWYSEALATVLAKQYSNQLKFDCTLEDLIMTKTNYISYYTIGTYIFDNYDNDYVLKLAKEPKFLESETKRLYNETKDWYQKRKQK